MKSHADITVKPNVGSSSTKATPSPSNARTLDYVQSPLWNELPHKECFDTDGIPILKNILLHLLRGGRLSADDASRILRRARELMDAEPNTLALEDPVNVVGDVNGQLYDLAKIFTLGGTLGEDKYLFLGNYIGSARFSSECLLVLFAAKVAFPQHIFLLRGNHDSRFMSHLLGVDKECTQKYSVSVYNDLMSACDGLPLAALISCKYFCVHGGLSPDISRVSDIDHIYRFREVPSKGAMCDLLWSDPHYDVENPTTSHADSVNDYYIPVSSAFDLEPTFFDNEQRGCGYLFNFACVKHFENVNKLLCIVRSNEVQDAGYQLYRPHPNSNYPSMICIFSAPNYCDTYDNCGAIMRVTKDSINMTQFYCSPHPFALPNMNGITWSLPYLADTTGQAIRGILGLQEADGGLGGLGSSANDEDDVPSQQRSAARSSKES